MNGSRATAFRPSLRTGYLSASLRIATKTTRILRVSLVSGESPRSPSRRAGISFPCPACPIRASSMTSWLPSVARWTCSTPTIRQVSAGSCTIGRALCPRAGARGGGARAVGTRSRGRHMAGGLHGPVRGDDLPCQGLEPGRLSLCRSARRSARRPRPSASHLKAVYAYDAADAAQPWRIYTPGCPGTTLTTLQPRTRVLGAGG